MASVTGFWSYTHADNEGDGGRISRLATLIQNEYRLLTGEQLNLFIDKDILWGQEWERVIDGALIDTVFLIPLVTPAYLLSAACRKEVLAFSGKSRSLGLGEFLLPILYAAPKSFDNDDSNDEVVALIKKTQWQDWRQLRLLDENSAEHRQAVSRVAARIATIVENAVTKPLPAALSSVPVQDEDDESALGTLDILGQGESTLPNWLASLVALSKAVAEVNDVTQRAAEELARSDRNGGGATGRLRVVHDYAGELTPYAQSINDLGSSFASDTVEVDASISLLLQMAEDGQYQLSERGQIGEFFSTLETVAAQVTEAVAMLDGYAATMEIFPGLSRDLRKPSRQIKHGLQLFRDGLAVFDNWVDKIKEIRETPQWNEPDQPDEC